MQRPGFWDAQEKAAEVSAEHARAKRRLDGFRGLESDIADLDDLAEMAAEDEGMASELSDQVASIEGRLADGSACYRITVANPEGFARNIVSCTLDGVAVEVGDGPVRVRLPREGGLHEVRVVFG